MTEQITMPPEVAKAIIAVKKQVKQLGKDDENKFAKFKYVSVDKFYAIVGQMMAAAGLFVVTDEISCDVSKRETQTDQGQVKSSVWLTAQYEMTLFHESGTQYGPIHRTITVPATGPQAFGSAMSYAEKYFLRSLFKVPTGEEDADAEAQDGVPQVTAQRPAKGQQQPEEAKHKAWVRKALGELLAMRSKHDMDEWEKANQPALEKLQKVAQKDYDDFMAEMTRMYQKLPSTLEAA